MKNLKEEANRCLLCKKPRCQLNCPIHTPIPEIIQLFKEERYEEAGEILFENNPLSHICGIVCPHETQCLGHCIKGIKDEPIAFYQMEQVISDAYMQKLQLQKEEEKEERVAIVGGGPAGITLAFKLAIKGYGVTIFDAHEKIGGVLRYGIPEYRLPNEIVERYEKQLRDLGVVIRPNTLIGPVITLDKLLEDGYRAVFIGTGVWKPKMLNIPGESLGHIHYAIDYLKTPDVYTLGNRVCVIGAGNVAMDAARVAKRSGVETVCVLYRKGFENMPCTKVELEEAREDGVIFELFKAPVSLSEEGVHYMETENVEDASGRIMTRIKEETEGVYPCDSVIVAVSQEARNNIIATTEGLEINKWGLLVVDENGHTTKEGVFASGDVVTGAETVVKAVAHAKRVAEEIHQYIQSKK